MEELKALAQQGNTHLTHWNDDVPVRSCNDLAAFSTAYEVAEHCFEMSTDRDQMYSIPVSPLYKAMESEAGIKFQMESADESIDLADLLSSYYRNGLDKSSTNINNKNMNEKNFDYLKDQVLYTGFGEALEGELRQNMEKQQPTFTLQHDAYYGDSRVSAALNFRKSDQSDLYFFNSYKVQLQKEGKEDNLEQTFYINRGSNITLKEAFNLMEGRSVNKDLTAKDGEVYNTWVQIDFKNSDAKGTFALNHYHENYGFDLEGVLAKHPIKELENPKYKEDLINSLKKGNLQSATFVKDKGEVKQYIEANPQFKTINIYDSNLKRLDTRQRNEQQESQGKSQSQSKASKKESAADDEAPADVQENKKRRKSQSM
ncbi:hypothetical protein [Flavobacterium suzhouense]|uniref:DUF3945 domain-containing protein n=1 Tax=Flavobacterium suzhouense TaxID=1529638 RepID=A0ABW5NW43_9FLAO